VYLSGGRPKWKHRSSLPHPHLIKMETLAALPLPVLKLILSLADDARHDAIAPWEPHVPTVLLDRLELSDAARWGPVVKQLRDELEVALSITLVRPLATQPISTLMDGAVWKPVPVRSLRLMLVRNEGDEQGDNDEPDAEAPDNEMRTAWGRMFAKVPQLERLDVRSFRLDSPQLPLVLEAASTSCSRLRALVLGNELSTSARTAAAPLAHLRRTLYASLQRWRETVLDGGLQQLEFPVRYAGQEVNEPSQLTALEGEFFAALAKWCPALEYLNALGAPAELHRDLLELKAAACPLQQWQQFTTAACGALVHVDWMNFPYSDEHFRMFYSQRRPSVKVLHFNGAEGEHTMSSDGNALYTSAGIVGVLEACPNLEELRIKFDPSLSIPFGSILQPLWNDAVLTAAARSCPRLEIFTLLEFDQPGGATNIPTPLDTITDDGVTMLAKLPALRTVKMKATRVTAKGVFELMAHAPTQGAPRKVKLEVGCLLLEGFIDDEEDELVIFHNVVQELLERIVKCKDALRGRRFVVSLRNRSRSDSDTLAWRERLHGLIAAAAPVCVQTVEQFGRFERVTVRNRAV
jgi:hypothetical protein